jgi:hypothetical protein
MQRTNWEDAFGSVLLRNTVPGGCSLIRSIHLHFNTRIVVPQFNLISKVLMDSACGVEDSRPKCFGGAGHACVVVPAYRVVLVAQVTRHGRAVSTANHGTGRRTLFIQGQNDLFVLCGQSYGCRCQEADRPQERTTQSNLFHRAECQFSLSFKGSPGASVCPQLQ